MKKLRVTDVEVVSVGVVAALAGFSIGDWLAAASVATLWLGFKLLVTGDGILAIFLAFAFQWIQVTVGIFYVGLTGRTLHPTGESDYRAMVLIGLGCLVSLAVGLRLGMSMVKIGSWRADERPRLQISWTTIFVIYAAVVLAQGTIVRLSVEYLSLRQILLTITVLRLGLLFLILRRMCRPFLPIPFAALVGAEVLLGMTGFFQGFREPLVVASVALAEIFDRRQLQHWVTVGAIGIAMLSASVIWMGIRGSYREDLQQIDALSTNDSARFSRVRELSSTWFRQDYDEMLKTVDFMVDRVWAIYYPALAVARVPSLIPHTDGSILRAAVEHVLTPRVFFPEKADLPSDSEMVRKYSGIFVAGREQGTSIAFGYAVESYIDFGIPMMFVPVFVFGCLMGMLYHLFLRVIWSGELAVGVVTVVFWLSLYLFERSWPNLLGYSAGLIVYLGVPMILVDRFLLVRYFREKLEPAPTERGVVSPDFGSVRS